MEFFERWLFGEGRGVRPLTENKAAKTHAAGEPYFVYLPNENVVLMVRRSPGSIDLGLLDAERNEVGVITWNRPVGPERFGLSVIQIAGPAGIDVRLERRPNDIQADVIFAPFSNPKSFTLASEHLAVDLPEFGRYENVLALPRDPWAYVTMPAEFSPFRPGGR